MNALRRLWHVLEYAAVGALYGLIRLMPVGLLLFAGRVVSDVGFLFAHKRRRIAMDNILQAGVRPDKRQARRLARASVRMLVATVLEGIVVTRRMTADNWQDYVTLVMPNEAERILRAPGEPLLIAAAHLGNWEVAARAASRIKPLVATYKPLKNPLLDKALHKGRSGEHLHLVSKYDGDPLHLMRTLKDGQILAIMADQHAPGGVLVQFFGRPAFTTPAVAMLHLVTRAPLFVSCTVRVAKLRYEAHVVGPLQFERTGDRARDTLEITQAFTVEIERFVRQYPEQYMWTHKRWKARAPETR